MVDVGLGCNHELEIGLVDTKTFPISKAVRKQGGGPSLSQKSGYLKGSKPLPDFMGRSYVCGDVTIQEPHDDDNEAVNFIGSRS